MVTVPAFPNNINKNYGKNTRNSGKSNISYLGIHELPFLFAVHKYSGPVVKLGFREGLH